MKKLGLILLFVSLLVTLPSGVLAANKNEVTVYLFRSVNCGHCEEALNYINEHRDEIPEGVNFVTYEVYNNSNNSKVLEALERDFNLDEDDIGSVPLFIVGDKYKLGYSTPADLTRVYGYAEEYQESLDSYTDIVKKKIQDLGIKTVSMTIDEVFPKPNKVVTIVVYSIFGVIVLGIGAMVLFSRKN